MKVNTLEKQYHCLYHETPQIDPPKSLIQAASVPIERMLELSR
ncbi:hypothetical protein [Sinomicrobium oceani]